MKFLFDLLPVILFFVAFKVAGSNTDSAASVVTSLLGAQIAPAQAPILLATAVAIVATFLQVAWLLLRGKKVDTMLWISLAIIVVFGGATLLLHDETFIKWKPTVLYWLFAAILLGGKLMFRRNLIKAMMEKQLVVPEPIWDKLNLSWIAFFSVMGLVNLYFAFTFSTETWVNFKLFGAFGLMLLFVIVQGVWLHKYVEQKEEP
jgi:intracellular septation protein